MTYEEIVKWANRAYPQKLYQSYSSWLTDIEQDFLSTNHGFPEQCYTLLEKSWLQNHKTLEPTKEKEEKISYENKNTVSEKLAYRFERLPSDYEFTPKELSRYTRINKNTIRRELQEFVRDRTLQRVRIGVYRLAP